MILQALFVITLSTVTFLLHICLGPKCSQSFCVCVSLCNIRATPFPSLSEVSVLVHTQGKILSHSPHLLPKLVRSPIAT